MSESALTPELGAVGVWASQLRSRDQGKIRDVAAGLDDMGFGALWAPGGWAGDLLSDMSIAVDASAHAVVASGVLNIWMTEANRTADWLNEVRQSKPGRILVGLGVSHPQRVAAIGQHYRPMAAMGAYLDELDGAASPIGPGERVLAALGPKMLELARKRTAGAHTYMVDPVHTAAAREALGPGKLLAPEVKVILDNDRDRAFETARGHIAHYLALKNYTQNLLRSGYLESDLSDGGSDRLIDGLFAIGDIESVRRRVLQHRDAGADHVCVQVVTPDRSVPWTQWRQLADALI
ncbi:TIGR03620 family F420-dependent LLM class oxidoreductase [Mycolicibacterium hodleri]|uniref:TIGR03620 family F420-dependent LLM class oxidoreductase n=1 Tax=Mycolicibacterium hodleri TaxID=49897 RepID=A0A502E6V7_9MYCO|nr:TIGR03620 family F420-dependent LLM class oxidoreductase [Mycolicibacterium hodleri]TPG32572.1 TIGR03620 family F420-dependent LLM class oxidoreductase [Mycolicibacterium hodleri]